MFNDRTILESGLLSVLTNTGWTVNEVPPLLFDQTKESNHPVLPKAKNCAKVGEASRIIKENVAAICEPDTFPLILGGDHCVAIGTISGIKERRPNNAIVWVSFFVRQYLNCKSNTG